MYTFFFSGLLDTFKSKISLGQQLPSISIAARLTYTLKMIKPWEKTNCLSDYQNDGSSLMQLTMGTISDPIR